MGPTIYMWIRLAGVMWPRTDIKSSLCKAITEQAAYDPFAISTFLFVMNLLDGRTYEQAKQEVRIENLTLIHYRHDTHTTTLKIDQVSLAAFRIGMRTNGHSST